MPRSWLVAVGFVSACVSSDDGPELASNQQVLVVSEFDYFWPAAPNAPLPVRDAQDTDLAPVHATLMPDGRVHFIGVAGNAGVLSPWAGIGLAAATPPVEVPPGTWFGSWRVSDSLFCGGNTLLADGSLLTIGGSRFGEDWTTPPEPGHAPPTTLIGLSYATRFDGTSWRRIADPMKGRGGFGETWRWYGQGTRLADGRVLVLGGFDYVTRIVDGEFTGTPSYNITAELFDPVAETFTLLPGAAPPPEIINGDYSHPFVLPYEGVGADVIEFGWTSEPVYLSVTAPGWFVERKPRPGSPVGGGRVLTHPNDGASSVMLPIRIANGEWGYYNGAVAIAGGEHDMPMEHHVDVWDIVANEWTKHVDIETRRHHPSTVLLPDGRLLILAGHDDSTPGNPEVGRALYLDPRNNFAITGGYAMMGEVRGYHTVTLLLPDGRVLVGGGRSAGPLAGSDEKPTMRYYYPSYLFRARPIIDVAPTTLGFNQTAQITARGNPTEAVLMALGSMTHSFDSNQRSVQIALAPRPGEPNRFDIQGPPNAATAPPGYYMLFVLDGVRTPSVASIIRVQ